MSGVFRGVRDFRTALEEGDRTLHPLRSESSIQSLNNLPTNYSITDGNRRWIMPDYIRYIEAVFILNLHNRHIYSPYTYADLEEITQESEDGEGNEVLINAVVNDDLTSFDFIGTYITFDILVDIIIVMASQDNGVIYFTYTPEQDNRWQVSEVVYVSHEGAPNITEYNFGRYMNGDIYFGLSGSGRRLPTPDEAAIIVRELRQGTPDIAIRRSPVSPLSPERSPKTPRKPVASAEMSPTAFRTYRENQKCYSLFEDAFVGLQGTVSHQESQVNSIQKRLENAKKQFRAANQGYAKLGRETPKRIASGHRRTIAEIEKDLEESTLYLEKLRLRPHFNKLRKLCMEYTDTHQCKLDDYVNTIGAAMRKYRSKIKIRPESGKTELDYLYELWKTNKRIFRTSIADIEVAHDVATDMGGVRREFFQKACGGVFQDKKWARMFYITEKDAGVYHFKFDYDTKKSAAEREEAFEFLGALCGWCSWNGFRITKSLSTYILTSMLHTPSEITDLDYVMAFLLDYPVKNKVFDMVRSDDARPYLDVVRENLEGFSVKPRTIHVRKLSANNFIAYITAYAKQRYTKSDPAIVAFKRGFIPAKLLQKQRVSIIQLDSLMTEQTITKADVEIILRNTRQNSRVNPATQRLLSWFLEILADDGRQLQAIREVFLAEGNPPANLPASQPAFLRQLLRYWGGSATVSETIPYKIDIVAPYGGLLVKSHTCFWTLDIPETIESKEQLLLKLLEAIPYAGTFSMA